MSKAKRTVYGARGCGALGIADGHKIVVGDRAAVDGRCRATTRGGGGDGCVCYYSLETGGRVALKWGRRAERDATSSYRR
jgi:hypothetical protein